MDKTHGRGISDGPNEGDGFHTIMDKTTRRVYAHKTRLGLGMGGLDEVEDQEGRDTCRVQGLTKVLGPQAGIGGS